MPGIASSATAAGGPDGDQGEHGTGKFISASFVLHGSSAAGPPDVKWFIDGVWRQRVGREVALLRKLERHPLRALFDRWQVIEGRSRPRRDSARPASPSRS
jgi:hypothetical protein